MLPHERLEVYWLIEEFVAFLDELIPKIREANPEDADQLSRAAGSMSYNVCEGASDRPKKDRIRFFTYTRRSIGECHGVLRRQKRNKVITEAEYGIGYSYADRTSAMMWNLIKAQ